MSAERFDKNGIRILDPPRNGLREKSKLRTCLPGQHRWKYQQTEYPLFGPCVAIYECAFCFDKLREVEEPYD